MKLLLALLIVLLGLTAGQRAPRFPSRNSKFNDVAAEDHQSSDAGQPKNLHQTTPSDAPVQKPRSRGSVTFADVLRRSNTEFNPRTLRKLREKFGVEAPSSNRVASRPRHSSNRASKPALNRATKPESIRVSKPTSIQPPEPTTNDDSELPPIQTSNRANKRTFNRANKPPIKRISKKFESNLQKETVKSATHPFKPEPFKPEMKQTKKVEGLKQAPRRLIPFKKPESLNVHSEAPEPECVVTPKEESIKASEPVKEKLDDQATIPFEEAIDEIETEITEHHSQIDKTPIDDHTPEKHVSLKEIPIPPTPPISPAPVLPPITPSTPQRGTLRVGRVRQGRPRTGARSARVQNPQSNGSGDANRAPRIRSRGSRQRQTGGGNVQAGRGERTLQPTRGGEGSFRPTRRRARV